MISPSRAESIGSPSGPNVSSGLLPHPPREKGHSVASGSTGPVTQSRASA